MGKQSQTELPHRLTDRTWRKQTSWCWDVVPKPERTGEIYPIILLDGIGIGSLVCLIARTPTAVIGWHWAGWESSNTWGKLLEQLPAPAVVVCDGQKGILLAIARVWPQARVQRCIFHVWQNIRVKLTLQLHGITVTEALSGNEPILQIPGLANTTGGTPMADYVQPTASWLSSSRTTSYSRIWTSPLRLNQYPEQPITLKVVLTPSSEPSLSYIEE